MSLINLKTPLRYYGGKQNLAEKILSLIPPHKLYCEPFTGGAAIFFAKRPADVEILNDTNGELINFYRVLCEQYEELAKLVMVTLHSRDLHRQAWVIYNNPDLFDPVKRAWAVWILCTQTFGAMIDGGWGYDISSNTMSGKIRNKVDSFSRRLSMRLRNTQIESIDALKLIRNRDTSGSFFYCDPPYFNSDCGHYDGYSEQDFQNLLTLLSKLSGKFLLSAYPSQILSKFIRRFAWIKQEIIQPIAVNAKNKKQRLKTEMLVSNYPFHLAQQFETLLF